MKQCTKCGAPLDDNAMFCGNCGERFNESYQTKAKTPVSIGGWIGRSLIPCIPLVGGLVYFIMLFIWSGNKEKEESFRNWAKAQLIVIGVVAVLSIILAVCFGSVVAELFEEIMYSL